MSVREQIVAEIDALPDERLSEVKAFVHALSTAPVRTAPVRELGIMAKLRKHTITGPEDFAENIDLYLNGEKHA